MKEKEDAAASDVEDAEGGDDLHANISDGADAS